MLASVTLVHALSIRCTSLGPGAHCCRGDPKERRWSSSRRRTPPAPRVLACAGEAGAGEAGAGEAGAGVDGGARLRRRSTPAGGFCIMSARYDELARLRLRPTRLGKTWSASMPGTRAELR